MNRRNFLKAVGAASTVGLAGCATRTAVHSDVQAAAQVIDTEHHDDGSTTATIEVVSDDPEGGTVGLHVHYFHYECGGSSYHSHMPSVYVPSGEAVTIRDTYSHDHEIACVTAHVHE